MSQAKHMISGDKVGNGADWLCGALPCYDVYRTKDGYISVGALESKFWHALCKALELPDLIDKHMVEGQEADFVRNKLQTKLSSKTSAEWETFFAPLDVMVLAVCLLNGSRGLFFVCR
jgi:alpha-methylacyl-CoA racemase